VFIGFRVQYISQEICNLVCTDKGIIDSPVQVTNNTVKGWGSLADNMPHHRINNRVYWKNRT